MKIYTIVYTFYFVITSYICIISFALSSNLHLSYWVTTELGVVIIHLALRTSLQAPFIYHRENVPKWYINFCITFYLLGWCHLSKNPLMTDSVPSHLETFLSSANIIYLYIHILLSIYASFTVKLSIYTRSIYLYVKYLSFG